MSESSSTEGASPAVASSHELRNELLWQLGRSCSKAEDWENAISNFERLVQDLEEKEGETARTASAWFEYGNALLSKEEANPTDTLMADVRKEVRP